MTKQRFKPLVISVEEAAEVLGVGRDLIYQLISSGRLRSLKIGSRRKISVKALNDFVDQEEMAILGDQATNFPSGDSSGAEWYPKVVSK